MTIEEKTKLITRLVKRIERFELWHPINIMVCLDDLKPIIHKQMMYHRLFKLQATKTQTI